MVPGEGLIVTPVPPRGRCMACEGPLSFKLDACHVTHVQPALVCRRESCFNAGLCLTCAMLTEWFQKQDAALTSGNS